MPEPRDRHAGDPLAHAIETNLMHGLLLLGLLHEHLNHAADPNSARHRLADAIRQAVRLLGPIEDAATLHRAQAKAEAMLALAAAQTRRPDRPH